MIGARGFEIRHTPSLLDLPCLELMDGPSTRGERSDHPSYVLVTQKERSVMIFSLHSPFRSPKVLYFRYRCAEQRKLLLLL